MQIFEYKKYTFPYYFLILQSGLDKTGVFVSQAGVCCPSPTGSSLLDTCRACGVTLFCFSPHCVRSCCDALSHPPE